MHLKKTWSKFFSRIVVWVVVKRMDWRDKSMEIRRAGERLIPMMKENDPQIGPLPEQLVTSILLGSTRRAHMTQ